MERILEHRGGLRAAIVLAGGRGSRLGGADKASLEYDGVSLLERAVAALASGPGGARAIAVVGPDRLAARVDRVAEACGVPVLLTRESPAFAGPAAAVAAGLAALDGAWPFRGGGGRCIVLAVDYVRPERIVAALRRVDAGLGREVTAEAWVPRDEQGWNQPLASLWDTDALRRAVGELAQHEDLENASMRAVLARIDVAHPTSLEAAGSDSPDLFADVDTWDDARRAGIPDPSAPREQALQEDQMAGQTTPDAGRNGHPELDAWTRELLAAYGLEDAPVDIDSILSLAGEAAHSIVRPAAPLTTWIVGYAAGLAAARAESGAEHAAAEADALARRAIADRTDG